MTLFKIKHTYQTYNEKLLPKDITTNVHRNSHCLFLKIELLFATHVSKYIISWQSLYL